MEKCKNELRKLKEEFENLTVQNDIVQKFKDCETFMKQNVVPPNHSTPSG